MKIKKLMCSPYIKLINSFGSSNIESIRLPQAKILAINILVMQLALKASYK